MKTVSLLLAAVSLGLVATGRADTTIDPVNRYAWGANIGFTDRRPSTTDGVDIGTNFCAGFIYAANVGWMVSWLVMRPRPATSASASAP